MSPLGAWALLTRNLAIAVCGWRGPPGRDSVQTRKVAKSDFCGIHLVERMKHSTTRVRWSVVLCQRRLFSGWLQSASVPHPASAN